MKLFEKLILTFRNTLFGAFMLTAVAAFGRVELPRIYGDHMVLQRDMKNTIRGQAADGETVEVRFAAQSYTVQAGSSGHWSVELAPMPAGGPHSLIVRGTDNEVQFDDILIGEVWFCSGQSNMRWSIEWSSRPELEKLTADYPEIRFLNVATKGRPEPQDDIDGKWQVCQPESIADLSAIGFQFGLRLHKAMGVPVGLINNAWGGSGAEAWVSREALAQHRELNPVVEAWNESLVGVDDTFIQAQNTAFKADLKAWEDGGRKGRRPRNQGDERYGRHRPGNIFNAMVLPFKGLAIRGVIWYQGESNADRSYFYASLFQEVIRNWRAEWGQGDFPFYWVQLPGFGYNVKSPWDSTWAEVREAQTQALELPNTGQVVAIDLGESNNLHPNEKRVVADRLAMLALKQTYGYDLTAEYPVFREMSMDGTRVQLTFDQVSEGLSVHENNQVLGFAIAGKDQVFHPAQGKIINEDTISIWCPEVKDPVAVRYAWEQSPEANVFSRFSFRVIGLPLGPFRTDDWPLTTVGAGWLRATN